MKPLFFLCTLLFSSIIYSQFSVDFQPNLYPIQSCNNYQNNYLSSWRPTHGSAYGDNSNRVELKVKDDVTGIKSEGLFIDLTLNGLQVKSSRKYRATFYYQKPTDAYSNTIFKAYLANGMAENSNSSCGEDTVPSVSDKKSVYTSSNSLELTYNGQVKEVTVEFISTGNYKYLWLYSDLSSKYLTNSTTKIYFTKVRIEDLGSASCDLQAPSYTNTTSITKNTAKLSWSSVSGASGYHILHKAVGATYWVNTTNTTKLYYDLLSLKPNTSYEWKVATKCSNGLLSSYSSVKTFKTLAECQDELTVVTDVNSGQTHNQSAKLKLTATNTINNGGIANYDAGNQVFLKPGFKTENGAKFKAYIQGCAARIATITKDKTEVTSFHQDNEFSENNLKETNEYVVSIYPNPNQGLLRIKEYQNVQELKISNMFGKIVFTTTNVQNVLKLPKIKEGVYSVQIITIHNKILNKKLIIRY